MIDSSGLDELVRDIITQVVAVEFDLERNMQKTMADIVKEAQRTVPVDTSFLQSSISMDVASAGPVVVGEAGPSASYGGFVESGTSRMAPRPYMEPALDKELPQFEARLIVSADRL